MISRASLRWHAALGLVVLGGMLACASGAQAASYQVPSSIVADCSADVTPALVAWIGSVPNNSVLAFAPGGCYRVDGTIEFSGRVGLDFEGNGAAFRSEVAPTDQHAIWRAWDSSGLVFRNMAIDGGYGSGGTFDAALQHAHAIDLRGSAAQIANVTMADVGGDCVYFGLGSTLALTRSSGTVSNSRCTGAGRNAVSVTAGSNILVQGMTTNEIGYDVFDVEPNVGAGWGAQSVAFRSNTIGTYRGSAYSIVENAPISGQSFTDNRFTARGMKITVGPSGLITNPYPVSGVTVTGNTAGVSQAPSAMNLSLVNGLTVTGNTVPVSGGTMAAVDSSCSVNIANNVVTGAVAQDSIAPYSCATSSAGHKGHVSAQTARVRRTSSQRTKRARHMRGHRHLRSGRLHSHLRSGRLGPRFRAYAR
jgi:hypothetical protein